MLISRKDYHLKDKIVLGNASFQPPFKASQPLLEEARFVHILHGTTRLHAPKHQLDLQSGDSILMKCDFFFNNWLENEDGSPSEVIVMPLTPDILQYIYQDEVPKVLRSAPNQTALPVERIEPSPLLDTFIQNLSYYLKHPQLISDELLKVKMRELILILLNTDPSGNVRSQLSSLFHTTAYEFKEIIHANLFEDLRLQDLAYLTGMSVSSFKRKFQSVYQQSPTQYIKTKRLEKAQSLLTTTDLRISDIAYDTGFNDIGYFSKSFHKAFGISPSDYRKQGLS